MTIFKQIIGVLWLIFLAYWLVSAIGVKKNLQRGRGAGIRLLLFIIILWLFNTDAMQQFLFRYDAFFADPIINIVGILLCGAGITFAIWARVNIGRNWGMPMSLKENAELVTTGPYAFVRHPIYTGILFAMIGSALVIGTLWLIPFVFFGIYFVYSAGVEEALMLKQFPNQYPDYKRRTKMLIPFVF